MLWEVWTRGTPFDDLRTIWAIRDAIEGGVRPPVATNTPPVYAELMQACWSQDPAVRPLFDQCLQVLQPMVPPQ